MQPRRAAAVALAVARPLEREGHPWVSPDLLRPEDVTVPVAIHHGTTDRLVPVAWADELGRRIPDATVTTHPGGGHLIPITRARQILGDLLAP